MKLPTITESAFLRGTPHMMLDLQLPWPPALNHLYATFKGRRILSSAGRAYKRAVGFACMECGHAIGRLSVTIWAHPPNKRKFDLDGRLKVALDALTESGIYADDGQIDHLTIHRCDVRLDGMLVVRIIGEYPG